MLRYDFDIFPVDNPRIAAGLKAANSQSSQGPRGAHKVVARFRHRKTSEAVTNAPPIVRLFLEESGFAPKIAEISDLESSDASSDEALKRVLVEQLTVALSNRALKKGLGRVAKHSKFDVRAFIAAVVSNGTENEDFSQDRDCSMPGYERTEKVLPRRPHELRGKGLKSRARPA